MSQFRDIWLHLNRSFTDDWCVCKTDVIIGEDPVNTVRWFNMRGENLTKRLSHRQHKFHFI